MNFHVGQRVICIDDSEAPRNTMSRPGGISNNLKKGREYVVLAIGLTHRFDLTRSPCIRVSGHGGWPVWAHRFRPVIERKTDIEVFQKMLTPTDKVSA